MEASKIGFSTIDNTTFEGRKKKVQKEHPKREKVKENAKRIALFLAGLATLGAATVVITANGTNETKTEEKKEDSKKTNNAELETTAADKKKSADKAQESIKSKAAVFEYQKALPEPKDKIYLLPHHAELGDDFSDDALLSVNSEDGKNAGRQNSLLALPAPDEPKKLEAPKSLLMLPFPKELKDIRENQK